jgi:hypothetical protein
MSSTKFPSYTPPWAYSTYDEPKTSQTPSPEGPGNPDNTNGGDDGDYTMDGDPWQQADYYAYLADESAQKQKAALQKQSDAEHKGTGKAPTGQKPASGTNAKAGDKSGGKSSGKTGDKPSDKAGDAAPGNEAGESTATDTDADAAANNKKYAALDKYSNMTTHYHEEWKELTGSEQQAKESERPLKVLHILADKGSSDSEKAQAKQFIEDNPSFKKSLQAQGVLDDKGNYDSKHGDVLINDMQAHIDNATNTLRGYKKDHPDAGQQSTDLAASLCIVKANIPLLSNATSDTAGKLSPKRDSEMINKDDLKDFASDPGTSSALKNAAKVWSTDGAFSAIDRSGIDKATNKEDGLSDEFNIDYYLEHEVPKSDDDYKKFAANAGLQNVTGNTSTAGLNADVFDNPDKYTPQQLAAVMVLLIKTKVSVEAGGEDGDKLKDTSKTKKELDEKISKLANDKRVQKYLSETMPPEMQQMGKNIAATEGHKQSASSMMKFADALQKTTGGTLPPTKPAQGGES